MTDCTKQATKLLLKWHGINKETENMTNSGLQQSADVISHAEILDSEF
jgi:hypothetical protein